MTTGIQVRLDKQLKEESEQIFADLGIDMPTGIRIFLKRVVFTKSIPFPLTSAKLTENGFSPEFEEQVLKAAKEDKQYGPFDKVEDMLESLNEKE